MFTLELSLLVVDCFDMDSPTVLSVECFGAQLALVFQHLFMGQRDMRFQTTRASKASVAVFADMLTALVMCTCQMILICSLVSKCFATQTTLELFQPIMDYSHMVV